jgi:hypothetical protein
MAGPTCIRPRLPAQRIAKAHARASSSTCRPDRLRFSSAASRAIKSPSSFPLTNSLPPSAPVSRMRAVSGERAFEGCGLLAAFLPAPPHVFSGLRPLLVPPLKKGRIGSDHRPYQRVVTVYCDSTEKQTLTLRVSDSEAIVRQCRKCRIPVKTIATSASSATAITSASRTDPPG